MSLHITSIPDVPEETRKIAQAVHPKGNRYMTMRDVFGTIYTDMMFADLYPTRGQPSVAAWRLALVTVMQFAEGLSDRQAADRVRDSIAWKYALSLDLTDSGFDASVLSEFRTRLVTQNAEDRILAPLLETFKVHGLLKTRGQQRTDSTHILAAVRTMNRLECVGETLRHALNSLSGICPVWLQSWVPVTWYEMYGTRFEKERFPQTKNEQIEIAERIGADGAILFEMLMTSALDDELRHHYSIEILRKVWFQNYYTDEHDHLCWRSDNDTPPASQTIYSPYDPEATASKKRSTIWMGYKSHMTETCDNDQPHLIVHVETTAATVPDHQVIETIHAELARKQLLPGEHIVDTGYIDAHNLLESQQTHQVDLLGPAMPNTQWQAQQQTGYDMGHFVIDWQQRQAICPQGKVSNYWYDKLIDSDEPDALIRFSSKDCLPCPARQLCTRSKSHGRSLHIPPQSEYMALQQRREAQQTDEFKESYKKRAGIEGTISQSIRRCDMRQSRYIGLAKTHLQHVIIAAALNLIRVIEWFVDPTFSQTRQSRFAALAP